MAEDCFNFKTFSLQQSKHVFRMCSDSLLLALLSRMKIDETFAEAGSGTGIVSLLLMQRGMQSGIAIELNEDAAALTKKNFLNSPWHRQLDSVCADFLLEVPRLTVNHVFCNPPFFKNSMPSDKDHLTQARHRMNFQPDQFFCQAVKWIQDDGSVQVIFPMHDRLEWLRDAASQGLFPVHETVIYAKPDEAPIRSLVIFKKNPEPMGFRNFMMRDQEGKLQEEYRRLLSEVFLHEPA